MNFEELNNKEYLLEISKDVQKLSEACDKDIGILFAKFKHFSIYPDFDILKEIKTVPARLFLINNYDLDDNQINEFVKDPYSGFIFLKDNSPFLKNMPLKVVKNPVQYAKSVDIGSSNSDFELGENFKELSTWLKVFKYNVSKVLDLKVHPKKMIDECFNKLANESTQIELNEILKLKEVRELFKRCDSPISNPQFIKTYWEHEFDLSLLDKLSPFSNLDDIAQLVDFAHKKNKKWNINTMLPFFNDNLRVTIANKPDFFKDFSNKSLNFLLDGIGDKFYNSSNIYNSVTDKTGVAYRKTLLNKSRELLWAEDFTDLLLNFIDNAIQEEDIPHLMIKVKSINKYFKDRPDVKDKIIRGALSLVVSFVNNSNKINYHHNGEFLGEINELHKTLANAVLDTENVFLSNNILYKLDEKIVFTDKDNLNKLVSLTGFNLADLPKKDKKVIRFFEKMTREQPELINDFIKLLEGGDIPLSSPVLQDPLFSFPKKEICFEIFKEAPTNIQKFLIDKLKINVVDTDIEFSKFSDIREVINAENKLLISILKAKIENKKELSPNEQKYLEVFKLFSKEKNVLGGQDCDLDVAFKKLQKLRDLNTNASDVEVIYQEKLIMYMVAGHSTLKKHDKLNDLLTKWAGDNSNEVIYFNNIWKVAFDNNYFFNNHLVKTIKERKFDNSVQKLEYLNLLSDEFLEKNNLAPLEQEDKLYLFKNAFASDDYYMKKDICSAVNNAIFKMNFKVNEELGKYLMDNAPAIALSGKYSFSFLDADKYSFEDVYQIYKKSYDKYGFEWLSSNQDVKKSNILPFIKGLSKEDFMAVMDKSKKEFPDFYSLVMSPSVFPKLIVDGAPLSKDYEKWDKKGEDIKKDTVRFMWEFIDENALIDGYKQKLETYNTILKTNKVEFLTNFSIDLEFEHFYKMKEGDNLLIEKPKAQRIVETLLEKDVGFFPLILEVDDIFNVLDANKVNKILEDKVQTPEDLLKVVFSIPVISKKLNKDTPEVKFLFKTPKRYHFEEGFYKKSISHLIENSFELADNLVFFIDNLVMAKSNLYPSSKTSLQNITFAHTSQFLSHLDDFKKYDFNIYDFAKTNNLRKQINENMDKILQEKSFESNDSDSDYQFKI